MATFGITDAGFTLKRLADILGDMVGQLTTITDPVTGETLTTDLANEDDPLVLEVNAFADGLAAAWEQLQLVYNQFDPNKATGVALSGLVQLNGLRRKAGSYSTVQLTVTGTAGLSIAEGQQVSPMDDSSVFILPAFTFSSGGTATVTATCSEMGPTAAEIGTLVKIVTPQAGWTSVTNLVAAVEGANEETDTALRARRSVSTSSTAVALIESVYSALIGLDGVKSARAYQNITDTTDARGVPSKNIAVVIKGGTNAAIAQVLWEKASAFTQYGTTTVNKTDSQGVVYPMKFSRPVDDAIYIVVNVTVVDVTKWPADGDDLIIASIMDYVTTGETSLGSVSGIVAKSWGIGEDIYASDFYPPVASIPGIQITSIKVGTAPTPTGDSVVVAWNHIASFSSANIVVNVG